MDRFLYSPEVIVRAMKIEVSTKIIVRDYLYEEIIKNADIIDKFKLNVKRLNRWYYSIYFDKICEHHSIKEFWDKKYCLECGELVI